MLKLLRDSVPQVQAMNSDVVFVVTGSSGLVDALRQRGVNAIRTQLLFSSGSPGK